MKSTDRILATRYARAFDALAQDSQEASRSCQSLCAAAKLLEQAKKYMDDPVVSSARKTAFIRELFGQDKPVAGFICALLEAKRYYLLNQCVNSVQELLDRRLGVVRATVQTAFELTDEQKKRVEESLGIFTGKTAKAEFTVDPELLGGVRMQTGDVLIDGTLKRQFEKLQEELTK